MPTRKSPDAKTSLSLIRHDDPLWARLYAFTLRTLFPIGAVGVLVLVVRAWLQK